ncbi:tetratricopeptide repeat protein, partial [bacterium]|nr:tetratricopeptide repeat protein [bacterium]
MINIRKVYPQISQIAQIKKNFLAGLTLSFTKSVKICVICGFLLFLGHNGAAEDFGGADQDLKFAYGLFSDGLYEISTKQFQRFLLEHPKDTRAGDAQYYLACSLFGLKEYGQALTEFQHLIDVYLLNPFRIKAMLRKGDCLFSLDRFKEAILPYREIVKNYSGEEEAAEAQFKIGESFYYLGEYERAKEAYQRLIETYPASGWLENAYYSSGWCHFEQKNFLEAIASFGRVA